jgi:hypothetical protein
MRPACFLFILMGLLLPPASASADTIVTFDVSGYWFMPGSTITIDTTTRQGLAGHMTMDEMPFLPSVELRFFGAPNSTLAGIGWTDGDYHLQFFNCPECLPEYYFGPEGGTPEAFVSGPAIKFSIINFYPTFTPKRVPEPATLLLVALGLIGVLTLRLFPRNPAPLRIEQDAISISRSS